MLFFQLKEFSPVLEESKHNPFFLLLIFPILHLLLLLILPFILLFLLGGTVWTQYIMLTRQILWHLRHIPSLSCFGHFSHRVSRLCPGWSGLHSSYLCFPLSWDGRHMPPCPIFIGWDGDLATFCLGFPETVIFPASTSRVAIAPSPNPLLTQKDFLPYFCFPKKKKPVAISYIQEQ
jgi:hypothetical protein